ncbi:MAG: hypothetical protein HY200_01355 [Nitrospirae bacterium]|nr:hypothetical protein [Nitrospirota bacterium]MBI3593584.1 hypothetical protein [Nitrospirota bacterium]
MLSLDAVMRWLHFLGVITWVGGMMFQLIALQPFLKVHDLPARLPLLFPVIRRFLMMTWSSITLLIISGSDMLIRVLVDQKVSLGSRLGMILLVKFMLVGLMLILFGVLFFGFFFDLRIHYRALLKNPEPGKAREHFQAIEDLLPSMRNLTIANLVVGLVVILVIEMAIY